jgi:hypothetical protein
MTPILGIIASSNFLVPSSFESIATATPSGTNTVTFSSIPSTYKSLQIRFIGNNTAANTLNLQFNGDTGTNYAQHILEGNGMVVTAGGNASGAITGIYIISLSSVTNNFSAGVIDIIDYASTTKNKTIRVFSGRDLNGSGIVNLSSGLWLNTAAVSSITLYVPSNYATGTTFALYGIKGA